MVKLCYVAFSLGTSPHRIPVIHVGQGAEVPARDRRRQQPPTGPRLDDRHTGHVAGPDHYPFRSLHTAETFVGTRATGALRSTRSES